MKRNETLEYARLLVDITINKHKKKLLGKETMSTFMKSNLPSELKLNDYNKILHLYNKYLAKAGYEIRKDITKFDIIDYNSNEYQINFKNLLK